MRRRWEIFLYANIILELSACVSFDETQVRNVLSRTIVDKQGAPILGTAANHFAAQFEGEHLRLNFGTSGDCEYERVAREQARVTTTVQPRATQWRVGGRAFVMTSVLSALGLAAGSGLLASGFYADRPVEAVALWASGGALLLGGALGVGNILYIAGRTRSRTGGTLVLDRPMEIFRRACDASPYRYTALRLRRGTHSFGFGTDQSGQLSLLRRQLHWLGLGEGTWEVESAASGRVLGALTIPPFARGLCGRYRTAARPSISLQGAGVDEAQLPRVSRRAEALIDEIFAPGAAELSMTGEPALLLNGTLSAQPDLISVQVSLLGSDGRVLGWRATVAPSMEEPLARTVARLADELLCGTP